MSFNSRTPVWRPALETVRQAAAGDESDSAGRLLPYFWRQALAEAIKYEPDNALLLELTHAYFQAESWTAGDLDLSIGILRRLAQDNASSGKTRLHEFSRTLKDRLWDPKLPIDWLGNTRLQTAKLVDVLAALSRRDAGDELRAVVAVAEAVEAALRAREALDDESCVAVDEDRHA